MAVFVVDASTVLAWCFEDEATEWSESLLMRLRDGDHVVVPAHWTTEVLNGLLVGTRRNRIKLGRAETLLDELALLPIVPEAPLTPTQSKAVFAISSKHTLTAYDAAYLELALRMQLPLATLDQDLRHAAVSERVVLL